MPLRNFDIPINTATYQNALRRANHEGRTIEAVLGDYVQAYAGSTVQETRYTVQSGDTLTKIARQFYGDAYKYPHIQQANNINNAGNIWVGQQLIIPAVATAPSTPQPTAPVTPQPSTPTPPPSMPQPSMPQPSMPQPVTPQPVVPQPQPVAPPESSAPANDGFLNGDFETFQARYRKGEPVVWRDKYPEEHGEHWDLDVHSEAKKRRTRIMSSPTFGRVAQDLYGGSGLNYAYGGGNSQVIASQYGFDVVLRQTIKAQPGRNYRFSGLIVSFYKGTDNPATPDKIYKTIGIDPTGGTDYGSGNVVWGTRDSTDHAWINPTVSATAINSAITVFIRLENTEENVGQTELNIIHVDKFELE